MAIVSDGWYRRDQRNQLRLGVFNARVAAQKAAGFANLMFDNMLDVMVVIETWIGETASDSAKYGLAPTRFNLCHVRRSVIPGEPTRGGSLANIAADDIVVSDNKLHTTMRPA